MKDNSGVNQTINGEQDRPGAAVKIPRYIAMERVITRLGEMGYRVTEYNSQFVKLRHPYGEGHLVTVHGEEWAKSSKVMQLVSAIAAHTDIPRRAIIHALFG